MAPSTGGRTTRGQVSNDSTETPGRTQRRVNRSCVECTRRKIKCDGNHPCSSCVYYRNASSCEFRQRSRRHAVSRSTFDKATEQSRLQAQILETLFPDSDIAELASKGQEELLGLLRLGYSPGLPVPQPPPQINSSLNQGQLSYTNDDSAPMSENGEPAEERHWDESLDQPAAVASDDINAIGLASAAEAPQHARSYLGVTSMSAVFRTIFRLCPAAKEHAAHCARALTSNGNSNGNGNGAASLPQLGRDPALSVLREQRCIDFYFEHVHPVTPMLDEDDFRQQYALNSRQDGSWMGLLNMVFALGSIASGSEGLHEQYYHEARSFTGLDSLGSGNINSLQALCLLGGYYLHYRNSPNMAYGILGAAHRVAIALGLHREPRKLNTITDGSPGSAESESSRRRLETHRRTWWSLYCLDTWACMTQGRPTCGRWETSTMDTYLPSELYPQDHGAVMLCANIECCQILERMQYRFAQPARVSRHEIMSFDDDLVAWWHRLPAEARQPELAPPRFQFAQELMKTRYHNARVILGRSLVLYLAHDYRRKGKEPPSQLPPEQRETLEGCCAVAAEAIDSTARYWTPNRIHVWNFAWYLFQACTIPLLAIAVERSTASATSLQERTASWQTSLAKALETFAEMRAWMRASDRSPDIVSALYEAVTAADTDEQTPSATDGSIDLFGWCDEHLTEMDWGVFLGDESMTRGMYPM